MMKARRHFAITTLVNNEHIATQEELCERLRAQGFAITQATVSRDIKELGLVKTSDETGYYYVLSGQPTRSSAYDRMKRMFSTQVLSLDCSENMVVIKTTPGAAQSVGLLIDSLNHANIIGNVGGDDTILVVVKPKNMAENIVRYFQSFL
jgi:transcriptional regulator of arginine metabolism